MQGAEADARLGLDKYYLGGENKNSRRHVFAFAVYHALFGADAPAMETLSLSFVATFWKCFETTCGHGVQNQNGTGNNDETTICVNWRHYRTRTTGLPLSIEMPHIDCKCFVFCDLRIWSFFLLRRFRLLPVSDLVALFFMNSVTC